MANSTTQDAISSLLANPSPESSSQVPEIVVQVLDLKSTGSKYMFTASDGKMKLKSLLQSSLSSEVMSGNIQNLGLIRILDYAVNDIPTKNEKFLIVIKCEVVSPALEAELKAEGISEESGIILKAKQGMDLKSAVKSVEIRIILKPKQELVARSVAQIVLEQNGNMAPSARMAMTRVHPLVSLNPYHGNWTIKVAVTGKGNMRTYKNAGGEGYVFNVELTDEDGTQIQATMFNEAAKKFYDEFQLGKVYYISKGTLKVASKQFKTVQNDYEMTLNANSAVEEASDEATFIPETKFNFVLIECQWIGVNPNLIQKSKAVYKKSDPIIRIRLICSLNGLNIQKSDNPI
ncbi:replication protein A 70 kDa DNA-binding subunit B-like isoform X1 [Camellia sinensis]|uniref:replication protein A 70 kDa DNA-binding subunit B-like isoform X1 n=1 Tax=Camellia sinensis TaxID=4442 RepID=UPI001035ABBB|nr:replication protein A 70 kDa DNA-binding subunit B-like isoform X1 [Camellia sinensis]XP_028059143.1 replication protein A 70 kDa DNA-binding subunit B-like isoform X1 [Camellia sinensis]